jgi:intraflagellar transport protein 172
MFPTLHAVRTVVSISLSVICYRYIHNQDWQNAQRVAEEHDPNSLAEVLLGQAKDVFDSKNYPHFESLLLRAQKPELIIKYYQVIRR